MRAARPEVAVGLLNPVGGVVAKSGVHALRRDEHFESGLPCGDDHINLLGVVLAQEVGARAGCLVVGPAAPKDAASFYEDVAKVLGIRIKEEFGSDFRLLAAVGAAVVEGLGLRRIVAPEAVGATFEGSLFGSSTSTTWTVPAVGYTAVALAMLEPDPEYDESSAREILQKHAEHP